MPPLELPANKTKSAIRGHGGNEIIMQGAGGSQQMRLHSPHSNTTLTLGAPNSPGAGFNAFTDAIIEFFAGGDWIWDIQGQHIGKIKGPSHDTIHGYKSTLIGGFKHETVIGAEVKFVGGV